MDQIFVGVVVVVLVISPIAFYKISDDFIHPLNAHLAERLDRIHRMRDEELSLVAESENITKKELWNLETILRSASFRNKTVILTTINEAWAAPDSLMDIFMESFLVGDKTENLLGHVLMVALDQKAYDRCQANHINCYKFMTEADLSGEKLFMTEDYLKLVWKKIDLMRIVLKMGYNLVFSDADIVWLRDPFPHLSMDLDAAFSCDHYNGNETNLLNEPNTGFVYFQSTNRTLELFKLWMKFRWLHPSMHDQDVMIVVMKSKEFANIGIKFKFLSTNIISGFCSVSKHFESICTMHANCCTSSERKAHDLRLVIERRKYFRSQKQARKKLKRVSWTVPKQCKRSWTRKRYPPKAH